MAEHLVLSGTMVAHTDRVTAIAVPMDNPEMIVSASRDKSIIVWHLTKDDKTIYGVPSRKLTGHFHYVQDVALSSDGHWALSGSLDGELRLWDLANGTTARTFMGHKKEVLSVAFSTDDRQIVSASRDHTIKVWDTLGECKFTTQEGKDQDGHTRWVSCVRFSPDKQQPPTIVSASWDQSIKVWNLTDDSNLKLRCTFKEHNEHVNTVAISPEGSLIASGGKDGLLLLWHLCGPLSEDSEQHLCYPLAEQEKSLYTFDCGAIIHAICFSPNRYWVCVATEESIKIWDLCNKVIVDVLEVDDHIIVEKKKNTKAVYCTSLNWSADGSTLFCGHTDGVIRIWRIERLPTRRKYRRTTSALIVKN